MPFNIGPLELIIVLVIALLILGPGKLPEVGSSLGKSIREFRKAASDVQDVTKTDVSPLPPTPAAPQASSAAPQAASAAPQAASAAPQAAPMVEAAAPVAPSAAPAAAEVVEPIAAPPVEPVANVLTEQATPNEIQAGPRA